MKRVWEAVVLLAGVAGLTIAGWHRRKVLVQRDQLRRVRRKIVIDAEGFHAQGMSVAWAALDAVWAYKRDLFAYDEICVLFHHGAGQALEVGEHDEGFMDLLKEMERRLEGLPARWYTDIMFPPFSTEERVLWRREGVG
ncbi:MAG TPA: hypothetical protein VH253_19330 [Phycisphaerae bacterium]|nr:hypothetical protein [Phycisphaerae bacterium]